MRVGTVTYCTDQGISHLARDFYRNGVITDPLLLRYPRGARTDHPEWYPPDTPVLATRTGTTSLSVVRDWMKRIDVVMFVETPFDWQLVNYARNCGKKTALLTMYEWWLENPPALPDLFLCPSRLDRDIFRELYGERDEKGQTFDGRRIKFIPVPAPELPWTRRTTAWRFLHNSGHVGSRNHKGTDTLLWAMRHVTAPVELTVRCQSAQLMENLVRSAGMPWMKLNDNGVFASRTGVGMKSLIIYQTGDLPYDQLFAPEYDVYVTPERYNGLSLPLQEAFTSGMPVITTDRYPTNTWLPRDLLVPPTGYNRVRAAPGHLEIDEAQVDPKDLAAKMDAVYGTDVSAHSDAGKAWAEANSWAVLGPKYRAALEGLL